MNNLLNLPEIDQEQAFNLSKFFISSQQNIFLFGRRGIGKTHIALQAAQSCNVKVNYINLSVIERPDLAGYPDMHTSGEIVKFKSPIFLPSLLEGQEADSIILFDEVDKASPEITQPLLEILQFRKINNKRINALSCILTGNLSNEGAYSNIVSSALLDRGAKYILGFSFDKWVDWAKLNGIHDLILGFLRSNPDFACGKIEDTAYATPSPRAWSLASDALIKARDLKMIDIDSVTHIISGFVGYEAGLRFKTWYEHYRKFESFVASLIESGEMALNFNSLAPTEKIVFIISLCYYAKQKTLAEPKPTHKYLKNLCVFFENSYVPTELQVIGLYNSFDFEMITKHKLYTCKEFFDLFSKVTSNINIKK